MSPVKRQRPAGTSPLTVQVERPRVGDSAGTDTPPTRALDRPDSRTPGVTESVSTRPSPPAGGPTTARYLTMERVDARLRPEQVTALADLARQLQRARRTRGERLTSNTLLRVAVDLLLAHADALAGDTEDALRASLGLPDSGTPEVQG